MSQHETLSILAVAMIALSVTVAGAIKGKNKPGPCHGKRCGN